MHVSPAKKRKNNLTKKNRFYFMKQTPIRILSKSTSLLFLSGALCLQAVAGNETWTGAVGNNNWGIGGNWAGPNTPPAAGDVIAFGA